MDKESLMSRDGVMIDREKLCQLALDSGFVKSGFLSTFFRGTVGDLERFAVAVCKWQRERDAEICKLIDAEFKEPQRDDFGYGCIACGDAILNQGSQE